MPEILTADVTQALRTESPEIIMFVPIIEREQLKDIQLGLAGIIELTRSGLPAIALFDDVHVYFNGKDITANFLTAVSRSLQSDPRARHGYQNGIDDWVSILSSPNQIALIDPQELAQTRAIASRLSTAPWTSIVSLTSWQRFGYQGGLNPFFFFGSYIDTPLVSFSSFLPANTDGSLDQSIISDWRIIISKGRSRQLTGTSSCCDLGYMGQIKVSATYLYEDKWRNELREKLSGISAEVGRVADRITQLAADIQDCDDRLTALATVQGSISNTLSILQTLISPPTNSQ